MVFGIASSAPVEGVQRLTKLYTDYTYSYSSHPNCVLTAITKNLCKRQGAINKEVRSLPLAHQNPPRWMPDGGGGPLTPPAAVSSSRSRRSCL